MRICARCDRLILPGEKAETVDKPSPSGGGITLFVHPSLCKSAQLQTSPAGGPDARRGDDAVASHAP